MHRGKKTITIGGVPWEYDGEMNKDNKAYGVGEATCGDAKYEGHFMNDQLHGFCKTLSFHKTTLILIIFFLF